MIAIYPLDLTIAANPTSDGAIEKLRQEKIESKQMKTVLQSILLSSVIAIGSISTAAAFTSTGVIERISHGENIIFVRNGDAYRLPDNIDIRAFQVGQRVNVHWDTQNPSRIEDGSRDVQRQLVNARGIEQPARN
ncbi:DUF1344 domain-containing protein [Ochrobactrum vermis]|uniref:DUF1344 domain-containing protein n=1 Tax=Ochrobactrum vermis TaxID=1827297 RepID=A0ABU8PFS7_9HYPH|nr:DUF1344 domain-containing protein [Ochrobactrum vermis]PQZ25514.1 hypothetical protein CQZ93_15690 [Ochrobactrum vermis]